MIVTASVARLLPAWLAFAASAAAVGAEPPTPPTVRTEVQINLCAAPELIERALDLRPTGPALEVWLFDDDALTLFERGLRFRLRVAADDSELTLKVAVQDCARLPAGLVPPGEGKCEYDIHGPTSTGAVSLSRSVSASASRDLLAGRVPLTEVLSAAQVRYLREVAGAWPLPRGVRPLGPQRIVSYEATGKPYGVEVARLPSGAAYIELSRKVPTAEAAQARDALVDELARAGVAVCTDQSALTLGRLRSLLRKP